MEKFMNFKEYIKSRGIIILEDGSHSSSLVDTDMETVREYLNHLVYFHSCSMGYNNYMVEKLPNKTGQLVSNYKTMCRKFHRELEKLKNNGCRNECDEYILSKGDEMYSRASNSLNFFSFESYLELIQRSMDRVEICVGNYSISNFYRDRGVIDISQCNYDMVEDDFIRVMVRLKRKRISIDLEGAIKEFIEMEGLKEDSFTYINGCLSYPYEFLRNSWRYFYRKREWDDRRYLEKLKKSVEQDGKSII